MRNLFTLLTSFLLFQSQSRSHALKTLETLEEPKKKKLGENENHFTLKTSQHFL
jgi:hypothetical protein